MARASDVLTTNLRLSDVALGVFTPRMTINKKWVKELAEDIKRNGQQKPIIVQLQPELPYPLIDGEHRIYALKLLGEHLVRAEVKKLSDEEATYLAMRINELHGLRLDPMEQGKQMFLLQEKFGWSQEKLAKRYGKSREWIGDRIILYQRASPQLKNTIATRVAMLTQAREIVKLPDEEQVEVLEKVKEAELGTRKTKALVTALKTAESPIEKELALEKIPKLKTKQAEKLVQILKDKSVEKRIEILEKSLKVIGELYKLPEEFEKGALTPSEATVAETITIPIICPHCGHTIDQKVFINWFSQTITPQVVKKIE